jgi:hypothetical protein
VSPFKQEFDIRSYTFFDRLERDRLRRHGQSALTEFQPREPAPPLAATKNHVFGTPTGTIVKVAPGERMPASGFAPCGIQECSVLILAQPVMSPGEKVTSIDPR